MVVGFLERDGDGAQGRYRNSPETAAFLDRSSPLYMGGLPRMLNERLFPLVGPTSAAVAYK